MPARPTLRAIICPVRAVGGGGPAVTLVASNPVDWFARPSRGGGGRGFGGARVGRQLPPPPLQVGPAVNSHRRRRRVAACSASTDHRPGEGEAEAGGEEAAMAATRRGGSGACGWGGSCRRGFGCTRVGRRRRWSGRRSSGGWKGGSRVLDSEGQESNGTRQGFGVKVVSSKPIS